MSKDGVRQRQRKPDEVMSARASIRNFCLSCFEWEDTTRAIRECTAPDCWLYPWRFGKTPEERKRAVTEAQRKASAKGLAKIRKEVRDE